MSIKNLSNNQKTIIKTVCKMLDENINKELTLNVYQLAKNSGLPYNTVRNNLTKIINI